MEEMLNCPAKGLLHGLFAALCNADQKVRWHGITMFGQAVSRMAEHSREDARVVMRRLMWSLNDESGGIGWGAPEAMGEIMACSEPLAREFHPILLSYLHEEESGEDNYLELAPLRRGAVWGVARLAQVRPKLLQRPESHEDLLRTLEDDDPSIRGLGAWAAGLLQIQGAGPALHNLFQDDSSIVIYRDRTFVPVTVSELARRAVERL